MKQTNDTIINNMEENTNITLTTEELEEIKNSSWKEGYDEGYDDGYSSGHDDGYSQGYNDAEEEFKFNSEDE